jgi:hypothetical protein
MTYTYRQAAQSAVSVQEGCNASGIIKTLAGPVMDAIWAEATRRGEGTRFVNRSPIIAAYLYKIGELNGRDISSLNEGYEATMQEVLGIIDEQFTDKNEVAA